MNYETQKITIKRTEMGEIAVTLATLASFPEDSFVGSINNIYKVGNSEKCSIAFHKDILDTLKGDAMEAAAYHRPHIIVGQILRSPQGKEKDWQPSDEYSIMFDTDKIDPFLIPEISRQMKVYRKTFKHASQK